jgi:hypothetical protein
MGCAIMSLTNACLSLVLACPQPWGPAISVIRLLFQDPRRPQFYWSSVGVQGQTALMDRADREQRPAEEIQAEHWRLVLPTQPTYMVASLMSACGRLGKWLAAGLARYCVQTEQAGFVPTTISPGRPNKLNRCLY